VSTAPVDPEPAPVRSVPRNDAPASQARQGSVARPRTAPAVAYRRPPARHRVRPLPSGPVRPHVRTTDVVVALSLALVFVAAACRLSTGSVADHVRFGTAATGTAAERALTGNGPGPATVGGPTPGAGAATAAPPSTARPAEASLVPPDGLSSDRRRLVETAFITGAGLSPKSVVYVPGGMFFAQNMMYSHTITAYDRSFERVATISDEVRLDQLGHPERKGTFQGSPVEAAATADGRYVYVSNYEMYGPGFANAGDDDCSPIGYDPSFLYRVDVAAMRIDQAIEVGAVPKFVAVTPDDRRVLVSNWCSYDLSVVDAAAAREVARVPLGAYPRGIAVDAARDVAYVAVMGSFDIAVVDLGDLSVSWINGVGSGPRHLVMDPAGRWLYATVNAAGEVVRIDPDTRQVVARVTTGQQARSMAIADDGRSLYVVNYESDTVAKVTTESFEVVQTIPVGDQPIGIAYDPGTRSVWVALYGGALAVYTDVAPTR